MKASFTIVAAAFLLTPCLIEITTAQVATHVVISEVYGGGGNSGSTFKNDYVELYNPTASPIDMTSWSLQYATAAGSFGSGAAKKTILSGSIPAYGFFLVKEAQGASGTTELPDPDATGSIAVSAGDGKVALANDTITVTGPGSGSIVDFMGYGSANEYEGSGAAGALSNTTCAERKSWATSTAASMASAGSDASNGNGWDSNNNLADFVIQSVQVPQNSASPPETSRTHGNLPPAISGVSRSPFVPEVVGTDTVLADVIDYDGSVAGVTLHVKVNSGQEDSSIAMTFVSGARYRGIIPSTKNSVAGTLVEYFLSATDDSANYSSTRLEPRGYFVGDGRIDSLKRHALPCVLSYGFRIYGTLSVSTNLFSNGQAFLQNSTGGVQVYQSGGLPNFPSGRNLRIQGTITDFQGAYGLGVPNFALVDTNLGSSVLTPAPVSLPTPETPANELDGTLVTVAGLSTEATGTFTAPSNYLFREGDDDTITVRVESYGNMNTLVGRTIPSVPTNVTGVLSFANASLRLKPRGAADMGFDLADGSGTATLTPSFRFQNQSEVSESLTVSGDGTHTLAGVSVTIPSSWVWSDTGAKSVSGAGFAGVSRNVSGDGTAGSPYIITISGASVTDVNIGRLTISHLTTPASIGMTSFVVKTRGTTGTLANIQSFPGVSIGSAFEAVTSGNWSSPSTWAGGNVPDSADDVSLSTPGVAVVIDAADARCHNLALVGGGSVSNSGPVLRFDSSGSRQLTVYNTLYLSTALGPLGGGGGDRGGRPQLTSAGNPHSTLIVRHTIVTTVSNSSANGNSGLNMNEGTVKLIGGTSDSLRNGSSFRLGDLIVGDGVSSKSIVWAPSASGTLFVRSVRVRTGSTFWLGSAANLNANNIGNPGNEPTAAYLDGGVVVESGAHLLNQYSSAGQTSADINLNGGGISNDGEIDLTAEDPATIRAEKHPSSSSTYSIKIGGLAGGMGSTHQLIEGTHVSRCGSIIVDNGDTLELRQGVIIDSPEEMTLDGRLIETAGMALVGTIEATRSVPQSSENDFGGIGASVRASGGAPGITTVTRKTGTASAGGGNSSIRRAFDVSLSLNTGLNATFDFHYDNSELNGQNAAMLALWKSTDGGNDWTNQGGEVDTSLHRIRLTGVNDFSRWTAADTAHALGGVLRRYAFNARWNMVSVPLRVSNDTSWVVYPTSVSPAYTYESGYVQSPVMQNGRGYWLKFSNAESVAIGGNALSLDTIDLRPGWNMIGSISDSVSASSFVRIPLTMKLSALYGYSSGYFVTDRILPAHGYWLKSDIQGKIVLMPGLAGLSKDGVTDPLTSWNSILISDAEGNSRTLYFSPEAASAQSSELFELPPRPPQGVFDARFASDSYVEFLGDDGHQPSRHSILIQASEYPVEIRWHIIDTVRTFELIGADNGSSIGKVRLSGEGQLMLTDRSVHELVLTTSGSHSHEKGFSVGRSFPNPFNPTTRFTFSMPQSAFVQVEIFDIVGRSVRTLIHGELPRGEHSVSWNGLDQAGEPVAAGIYIIQMTCPGYSTAQKLVLMR